MDYAVRFENVYKEYPFYQHMTAGVKSFLFNLHRNIAALKKSKFIALKGISFEVKKGETFGIIGRNGSGKSTILGLVAGVMRPNRGIVRTDGKIASLLELGAGFHPDLSGIENIIMNGILMGNTRQEMLAKADEIIEFSELGDFIYQPLRTYSSGMQMRLGFSVAVHIEPKILLVDEALAVGDASFQDKCMEKMTAFKKSGTTILIVSHDMSAIDELCDRVAWIESGSIMAIGDAVPLIEGYLKHLGLPMTIDIEEDQPVFETEIEIEADNAVIPQHSDDLAEPMAETESREDTDEISQPPVLMASWWDSPIILRQCESLITGDRDINLYEFLEREHSLANLQKGLSICNRLRGTEDNFIKYHTCRSFDAISDPADIVRLLTGPRDFKRSHYDLFLCIDLLNHIGDLRAFLEDISNTLKDAGTIVALEYIGPACFQWSEKETGLADMIYRALNSQSDVSVPSELPLLDISAHDHDNDGDMESAINSEKVIPMLQKVFDIVDVRYFGGPFYELLLNRILHRLDQRNEKDVRLISTIIQCEQILIKEKIFQNAYAMIIAKKKIETVG